MKKIELGKTGEQIPILGQGTWGIKSRKGKDYYDSWKKSLRKGIELGLTHIDTAEVYGNGASEKVVGEIISEYSRDDLFITSKLFPMHLRFKSMKEAAEKSLKRLGIANFDLYLIHWPFPLISREKQMKVLKQFQQGDLWIEQVDNLDGYTRRERNGWLREKKVVEFKPQAIPQYTLLHGEATGHSHKLIAEKPVVEVAFDEPVFRLMEKAILQHQEHNPITLDPGIYRFGQIFEYDYESNENRYIAD